jgi:ribose 1,5-bisphosphate isomerase
MAKKTKRGSRKSNKKTAVSSNKNIKKKWTRKEYTRIIRDIKNITIQGATGVAKAALEVLHNEFKRDNSYDNINNTINELTRTRPTEPMMRNTIKFYLHLVHKEKINPDEAHRKILDYFDYAKRKIGIYGSELIKNAGTYYTHCHSSDVMKVFKTAREHHLFRVFNTETRPRFQGRLTATELSKNRIPVVHFVDSGARIAIKDSNAVFLGCDAITSYGEVFNKIGSEMIAELAEKRNIPVYICTSSWKLDPYSFFGFDEKIEKRNEKEIWDKPPEGVIISNFAFEKIPANLITGIISEFGVLKPEAFINMARKRNKWMFE